MSAAWAADVAERVNGWPDPDTRATKLEDYWGWIEVARAPLRCSLALVVRDMPADDGAEGDTLLLDIVGGTVTAAEVTTRDAGEAKATYVIAGAYRAWMDVLDGYHVGKAVMYRHLLLEKGEVLDFFMAAYYWVELLNAVQQVPADRPLATA